MRRRQEGVERGSVAIEAAMLVPVFIVLVSLVIAAGRIRTADGVVVEASRDAARAASMATPDGARAAGRKAGADTLASEGLKCPTPVVVPHMNVGPGQTGTVKATVTCTVALSDLLWRGLPGKVTITSSFTAVVDTYRTQ